MLSNFFVCKSPYLYKDIEGNTRFKTCTAIIKEKAFENRRVVIFFFDVKLTDCNSTTTKMTTLDVKYDYNLLTYG